MQVQLSSGIPKVQEYKALIRSDQFHKMENFSNHFLVVNQKFLDKYARRWVRDPLHQWSRQWEYPYVFNQIEANLDRREATRILDAGSGITFFPYYLKSLFKATEIYCVDNDPNLEMIYQQINMDGRVKINFSCCDLKNLPFTSDQFDMIYCVSVLEHTHDYAKIIAEFYRVLRPGGRLLITFDISLDGTRDISVEQGNILLQLLADRFVVSEDISLNLKSHVNAPDLFTTLAAKKIDPNLLPWALPSFVYRLKPFLTGKRVYSWPPPLTVFCLSLQKKFP